MKKFSAIICSIILLATALFAFASCGGVKKVDIDRLLSKCDTHKEVSLREGGIDNADTINVKIKTDVYAVYVYEAEYGNSITLDYVFDDNCDVSSSLDFANGSVDVYIEAKYTSNYLSINKGNYLIVGIPESWLENGFVRNSAVEVVVDTGAVQIEDIEQIGSISVVDRTGTVYIDDCHADVIDVNVNTGAVYVEADCDKTTINTDTGAVQFDLTAREITVTTDTGSIKGTVEHPQYWYTIDAHTSTGSCNLKNRTGSNDYKLTLDTDTGSIKVRFDND